MLEEALPQIALSEGAEPGVRPRDSAPLRVEFKHCSSSVADSEEDFIDGKQDEKELVLLGEERWQGDGLQASEAGQHRASRSKEVE